MPSPRILVVDDEALIRWSLAERLKSEGYEVLEAETGRAALDQLAEGIDLVLLDYKLPDLDGVTVLRKIKEFDQDILVILLTAYASVETAVEAMKLGAYHFANKPFNLDDIAATVARALETTRLRREVRQFRTNAARPYNLHSIVGSSRLDDRAQASRRKDRHEPGVHGAADRRERHGQGSRRQDHSLLERSRRPAVHEHHMLRASRAAARERAVRPRTRRVHRRAAAEARPARDGRRRHRVPGRDRRRWCRRSRQSCCGCSKRRRSSASGARPTSGSTFASSPRRTAISRRRSRRDDSASDLFYRLNVLPVSLPPLRSHADDIPLLVEYFIDAFNKEFRKKVLGASASAYTALQHYGWPGNVRELRNVIERAMLLTEGDRLEAKDVASVNTAGAATGNGFELPAGGVDLEQLERNLVLQALRRCGGNQTRAATLLGLNRDQIRYRIEKFGLTLTP